jgi:hypothetical protein
MRGTLARGGLQRGELGEAFDRQGEVVGVGGADREADDEVFASFPYGVGSRSAQRRPERARAVGVAAGARQPVTCHVADAGADRDAVAQTGPAPVERPKEMTVHGPSVLLSARGEARRDGPI